jgi:hypothetical protein
VAAPIPLEAPVTTTILPVNIIVAWEFIGTLFTFDTAKERHLYSNSFANL